MYRDGSIRTKNLLNFKWDLEIYKSKEQIIKIFHWFTGGIFCKHCSLYLLYQYLDLRHARHSKKSLTQLFSYLVSTKFSYYLVIGYLAVWKKSCVYVCECLVRVLSRVALLFDQLGLGWQVASSSRGRGRATTEADPIARWQRWTVLTSGAVIKDGQHFIRLLTDGLQKYVSIRAVTLAWRKR